MMALGQICLLATFVAAGYAAFACLWGVRWERPSLLRSGLVSAVGGMIALTVVVGVLVWALLQKDFSFNYVAQYSSRELPWHYSLSALWVGQAGSLLLWTWMLGMLALVFRFWPRKQWSELRDTAFALLMAYFGFLVMIMVFAADPLDANIAPGTEGAGLSPLLQHPAMLIHPPIVFLGYATWAVPCALAIAALCSGGSTRRSHGQPVGDQGSLDGSWVSIARPWALLAWAVLGGGILLGAYWSYEELGWGGYWAWDPVENGSLIPWLIGSALIHTLMTWQHCGMMKKTSLALAIATFGMCNFATFLTRSGIFSSLHAFSQSPIGWLFLGLMLVLGVGGVVLIVRHRECLAVSKPITSFWTREAFVIISAIAMLLLATVTVAGTLSVALSDAVVGRRIVVGPEFYNHALMPVALVVLSTMTAAPLLRWGAPPSARQKKALLVSALLALVATFLVVLTGVRSLLALVVALLAAFSVATHIAPLVLQSWQRDAKRPWRGLLKTLVTGRRMHASFAIHLGVICIVVGVTGSSLGARRHELVMKQGEVAAWAGSTIHFQRLIQRDLPDRLIVEAELEIAREGGQPFRLLPAQHHYRLQDQWTSEVAIHSTWGGDFYTILHGGMDHDAVRLTLVDNPLMRCMWFGGWVIAFGTCVRLWPSHRPVNVLATSQTTIDLAGAADPNPHDRAA